jgi:hypothetical protein
MVVHAEKGRTAIAIVLVDKCAVLSEIGHRTEFPKHDTPHAAAQISIGPDRHLKKDPDPARP